MSVRRIKEKISFADIATNSTNENKNILHTRVTIINAFTLIAFLYCTSFAILYYYVVENILLSIVHLLASLIIVTNYFILIQTKKFNRATNITLATGAMVVIALFATGGWANTGYLWPFVYLPFAFFLTDKTAVKNWVAALFGGCIVVVVLHSTQVITIPYSPAALVNYFAALIIFTVCISLFRKTITKRVDLLSHTEILLEAAPDAVIVIDDEGRIMKWNLKSETLFGWTANETAGKRLSETIIPLRYREAHENGLKHFLKTGEGPILGKTIEMQALNKNNNEFDIALSISPTTINKKRLFIGFMRDITARKKAEEKIKESGHMFSTLFYKSPVMKSIIEASTGKYIEANDAYMDFFGRTKEEMMGKTANELNMFVHPGERDQIINNFLLGGSARDVETQLNSKNGKISWVLANIDKINLNGTHCFLIVIINITERKEAEEKIRQMNLQLEKRVEEKAHEVIANERRFRSMIEKNIDMMTLATPEGKLLYSSPSLTSVLGYSEQELSTIPAFELIYPDDAPELSEQMQQIVDIPGKTLYRQQRLRHKNGNWIWCEGTITNLLHDSNIGALVFNFRDISERKKTEGIIIQSETKYRNLFENNPMPMWVFDLTTFKFLDVNEAAISHYGYSRENFLSMTVIDIRPEEEKERFKKSDHPIKIDPADYNRGIWKHLIKNGTIIIVEIIGHEIVFEGKAARLVLSNDVTKRIKAEEEIQKLNEELEHRVRLRTEELEAFSYSVSHDLRAPLRAVSGFARILEEDYNKLFDKEGNRLLGVIQQNAHKMGVLIDDLLAFSRLGKREVNKSFIDMAQLTENVFSELNKTLGNGHKAKMNPLCPAMADFSLIHQVMTNLISNAIKYSSGIENPFIEIRSEKGEGEIIYSVSDNGAGFDMLYAHKLFGVFQRLHSSEEFEGTGVGLAIVKRIINKHNGRVWAEGKAEKGATFYFSLPDYETI